MQEFPSSEVCDHHRSHFIPFPLESTVEPFRGTNYNRRSNNEVQFHLRVITSFLYIHAKDASKVGQREDDATLSNPPATGWCSVL